MKGVEADSGVLASQMPFIPHVVLRAGCEMALNT